MGLQTSPRSVYILSAEHAFCAELCSRLESSGFQVDRVDEVSELTEMVMGLSPHAVIVDAGHAADLAAVGEARRAAQLRSREKSHRIALLAMLDEDSLRSRLEARRAGVGVLLFPPFSASDVVAQLRTLLAPVASDGVRVLIVEDDRSQALFAQSILNNAGIQAEVEQNPLHVLEALEALRPDLVLMDLHMPDANGVELTALIRENPTFASTPIVFLSGESDPEARIDAIDAGGDDFLAKPIRPRHLIASVLNRVRRVRSIEKPATSAPTATPSARDEKSGLYRRDYLLERIGAAIADGPGDTATSAGGGGVLFVKINGASALRSRIGLAALEQLFVAVGRELVAALGESQLAAGVNDNAYLVFAQAGDADSLVALGVRLREKLMEQAFEAGGMPLRLRLSVGVCPLQSGFADANAVFDAVERTCREARDVEQGVKRYVSPAAAERHREAARDEGLREAIRKKSLVLVYQPIVAVKGSLDAQYQTLVRLRDVDGLWLTAAEILPIAARARLLVELDRWSLSHALTVACQQRDLWRPVRLFVPQSMASLTAPDQADWIKAEVARQGAQGSSLLLECRLEDAVLNPPALAALAQALRKVKVRLCLVQYETGTDARRVLDEVPWSFLKLAPKYVVANATTEVRAELKTVIDRAHELGMQVIGPRVEDAQSAAALWMSGIDFLQGNLVHGVGDSLDFDFKEAVL